MWKLLILLFCFSFSVHVSAQTKVLAFAGSSRTESVNKKLVREAAKIACEMDTDVTYIDLRDYPIVLYDADYEATNGIPENVKSIRNLMINSQVIFIASPEYNGSLTGLLKNTLDWASRSETNGTSYEAFQGKKFVIMSASPGKDGGARGLLPLRAILEDLGGIVLPQQISISDAYNAFDAQGELKDKKIYADLKCLIYNSII